MRYDKFLLRVSLESGADRGRRSGELATVCPLALPSRPRPRLNQDPDLAWDDFIWAIVWRGYSGVVLEATTTQKTGSSSCFATFMRRSARIVQYSTLLSKNRPGPNS